MIYTDNHFAVSINGKGVALLNPPTAFAVMSTEQALALAAWLVAMADPLGKSFPDVLNAVQNT